MSEPITLSKLEVRDLGAVAVRGKWIRKPILKPGDRFGHWTVLSFFGSMKQYHTWLCRCDCGTEMVIETRRLRDRRGVPSCGCFAQKALGESDCGKRCGAAEYRIWRNIISRCCNPNVPVYKDYGGRGISICDEWRHSYKAFLRDVGRRPSPLHSIDRFPDNNGNYEPGNVRWAMPKEQARNTRANVVMEHGGRSMVQTDWAREYGISLCTLRYRLKVGWPLDRALMQPVKSSGVRHA